MKTIEEYNNERHTFSYNTKNAPTGIECPACKEELVYPDTNMVLACSPPKLQVKCLNCGYVDYVLY